jgi:succinoglycan biosynthesis protein ExoA
MVPFITVVMPVRNEARFIAATVQSLLEQQYPKDAFEILVVDGMSDDATRAIVGEISACHPQVRLLENPRRWSSAGRNIGFQNGRGTYFIVIDGHCYIPGKDFFQNVVDCFVKSGADCLGRPQPLDPPGLTVFQKAVALSRASRLGHGGDSLIYGEFEGYCSPVSNGAAYTRKVFETVGYVDEAFDAAEDVEFNYRIDKAGLTAYSSHTLTVRYYPRERLSALFRQMKRYGVGRCRFVSKHRDALTFNQLVPALFTLGLMCCSLAGLFTLCTGKGLALWVLITLPYFLYGALVLAESVRVALTQGFVYGWYLPSILLTIHLGLGVGFLSGAGRR